MTATTVTPVDYLADAIHERYQLAPEDVARVGIGYERRPGTRRVDHHLVIVYHGGGTGERGCYDSLAAAQVARDRLLAALTAFDAAAKSEVTR